MPHSKRPLYFMVKPPAAVGEFIASHTRASRARPSYLLHMTIQPVWDRLRSPPELIPFLLQIAATIDAPPFRVIFDRLVESRKTVALHGSEPMQGAEAFHAALVSTMGRYHMPIPAHRFVPHITIAYRPDGLGDEPIDPISWRVEEFMLVESVVGQTRHIEHGRWTLGELSPDRSARGKLRPDPLRP